MLSTLPYGNTLLKCRPVEGIREGTSAPSWTATESNPLESEEVLKLEVVRERLDLTQKCENFVTQQASHRLVVCQRSKSSENPSSSSFSVVLSHISIKVQGQTNFCLNVPYVGIYDRNRKNLILKNKFYGKANVF